MSTHFNVGDRVVGNHRCRNIPDYVNYIGVEGTVRALGHSESLLIYVQFDGDDAQTGILGHRVDLLTPVSDEHEPFGPSTTVTVTLPPIQVGEVWEFTYDSAYSADEIRRVVKILKFQLDPDETTNPFIYGLDLAREDYRRFLIERITDAVLLTESLVEIEVEDV